MSIYPRKKSPLENPILLDGLGLIFLFVFIGIVPPLGSDPGVGWHLKTGQWISEHWQIPHFDPFLWSTQGKEWISNQWLSDLIFWFIYRQGGWDALAVFCFSLPLITMICLQGRILLQERILPADSTPLLKALLLKLAPSSILALSLLVAWVQWIVRPVIFSFVLFSILFYWIWSIKRDSSLPLIRNFMIKVAMLFALWANLHSAFPLGFIIIASAALASLIEKDFQKAKLFVYALALALCATLINPYCYKLHLNIIELLGEPYFMKLNNEWLSPSFSDPIFLPLVVAFALLVFRSGLNRSVQLWLRYVGTVFSVLALRSVRYTPFLGLILPAILQDQSRMQDKTEERSFIPFCTIIVAFCIFVFALFSELPAATSYSSKILKDDKMWQVVKGECKKSGGKIYNHPDLGGAITFVLGAECQAGLDDRNELNGVAAYKNFFDISALDSKIDISTLPELLILECKSNIAALSRHGFQGMKLKAEFERFCLIGKSS